MGLEALKAAIEEQKQLADQADQLAESGVFLKLPEVALKSDKLADSGIFLKLPNVAPISAPRVITAEARDENGKLVSLAEHGGTATVEELHQFAAEKVVENRAAIEHVIELQQASLEDQKRLNQL